MGGQVKGIMEDEVREMSDEQQMVAAFHRAFDIAIGTLPAVPDAATWALRVSLIQEEFAELREALRQQDIEAIAKELADLLYVVYGTAVVMWDRYGPCLPGSASLEHE